MMYSLHDNLKVMYRRQEAIILMLEKRLDAYDTKDREGTESGAENIEWQERREGRKEREDTQRVGIGVRVTGDSEF